MLNSSHQEVRLTNMYQVPFTIQKDVSIVSVFDLEQVRHNRVSCSSYSVSLLHDKVVCAYLLMIWQNSAELLQI
jgi:hypothetical protein